MTPTLKRPQTVSANTVLFRGEKGPLDVTSGTIWSSSNPEVADVSQTGTVTAVNPGETVIQAAYGDKTATFRLQVLPSDNASLSSILMDGSALAGFDPAVFTYSVTTPNRLTSVGVSAQTSDNRATLSINDTPAANGELFGPAALAEGPNVFQFDITAEDGRTTARYTLTVNRSILPAAPANAEVRTDHSEATILWSASPEEGVVGYHVYLGETLLTEQPIPNTSFLVTGLHNGKDYDFSVTAVNSFHEESARSTVSAKIKPINDKKDY